MPAAGPRPPVRSLRPRAPERRKYSPRNIRIRAGRRLHNAFLLLNSSFVAAGWRYVDYLPGSNGLYLMNDAGADFLGPITPGSAATLQNSQCTLNASGSSATIAGNTLTLNVSLTFKPAFAGAKKVFVFAYTATANTGFQTGGTWTVPAAGSDRRSAHSGLGHGSVASIQRAISNPGGAAAFTNAFLLLNGASSLPAAGLCRLSAGQQWPVPDERCRALLLQGRSRPAAQPRCRTASAR